MSTSRAYEEVVNFIASGTNPDSVIAFTPSDTVIIFNDLLGLYFILAIN